MKIHQNFLALRAPKLLNAGSVGWCEALLSCNYPKVRSCNPQLLGAAARFFDRSGRHSGLLRQARLAGLGDFSASILHAVCLL